MTTKYKFESSSAYELYENNKASALPAHRRHRRSPSSSSDHDCNGSLTYSATSSINSGAGESTDSSFADIMKVLDVQDGRELASYLRGSRRDEKSVAESLAYSTDADTYLRSLATTDGESHLHGADLLSVSHTINSNNNNSHHNNNNNNVSDKCPTDRDDVTDAFADNIFFAPAEHTESIKQRKERKRQERLQRRAAAAQAANNNTSSTAASHRSLHSSAPGGRSSSSSSGNQLSHAHNMVPTSSSGSSRYGIVPAALDAPQFESRQGTPPSSTSPSPRPPKSSPRGVHNPFGGGGSGGNIESILDDDDDVWYAKWWMFCFPDAVKNMTEKR